jgi:hypothetical protein
MSSSTVMFQIMCPNLLCRKLLSVPEDVRGKVVKCQHCQGLLKVPAAPAPKKSG